MSGRPSSSSFQAPHSKWREWGCILALLAAVALSHLSFICYEQLNFDSDQAVVGLMARDLLKGRGFTVYLYGSKFCATIQPYLAVPLFALFGVSRWALKAPLVGIVALVTILFYRTLRRECGLRPLLCLLLVLPLALPTIVMAAQFISASGSHIEQFLWVILLWRFRSRPLVAGALGGFAIQNRILSVLAVAALLLVMLAPRQWRLKATLLFLSSAIAVYLLVMLADRYSLNHPVVLPPLGLPSFSNAVHHALRAATFLLPMLYGCQPFPVSEYVVRTEFVANPGLLSVVPIAAFALLAISAAARPGYAQVANWQFPCYLILIGLVDLAAFCLLVVPSQFDQFAARYLLLSLLLPVGAATLLIQTRRAGLVTLALALWAAVNLGQHAAFWTHLLRDPPPDIYADLAEAIRESDYTAIGSEYWTSYYLAFLLGDEVIVACVHGLVRVPRFQSAYAFMPPQARALVVDAVWGCPSGIRVHDWRICPEIPGPR